MTIFTKSLNTEQFITLRNRLVCALSRKEHAATVFRKGRNDESMLVSEHDVMQSRDSTHSVKEMRDGSLV